MADDPNLTNIGTTAPPPTRPLIEPAQRHLPKGLPVAREVTSPTGTHQHVLPSGIPEALPVARTLEEGPGERFKAPMPMWISRWQPSATIPLSKAPWIVAYRWWLPTLVYAQNDGLWVPALGSPLYRIDLKFKPDSKGYSHEHGYKVHEDLYREFRALQTSVGQWLHQQILGERRSDGTYNHRFPHFDIN